MNRFRYLVAASVATLIAATTTLAGVTPAHAATVHSVTVNLTDGTTPGCNATTAVATSQSVVYARPGDTLSIVFNSTGVTPPGSNRCGFSLTPVPAGLLTGWMTLQSDDYSTSPGVGFAVTSVTWQLTVGTVNADVKVYESGVANIFGLIFSVIIGDPPVDETPPDFIQQFAIPSGGTCELIPDGIPLFNVSRSGGWEKSWAQWPNEGRGGAVCTRTVRFEPSIRGWVPRA
jgi:hypothetical protein